MSEEEAAADDDVGDVGDLEAGETVEFDLEREIELHDVTDDAHDRAAVESATLLPEETARALNISGGLNATQELLDLTSRLAFFEDAADEPLTMPAVVGVLASTLDVPRDSITIQSEHIRPAGSRYPHVALRVAGGAAAAVCLCAMLAAARAIRRWSSAADASVSSGKGEPAKRIKTGSTKTVLSLPVASGTVKLSMTRRDIEAPAVGYEAAAAAAEAAAAANA